MTTPTLAAILSAEADNSLWENVIYLTAGFTIVISALAILWALCAGIGTFFIRQATAEAEAKAAAEAEAEAVARAAREEGPEPAVIAVITAAVEAAVHRPLRLLSVRSSHQSSQNEIRHSAWTAEGRSRHFQSHQVR